jgi:hypothetical protein
MTCDRYLARKVQRALRDSGWGAADIAWRAKVSRVVMARVLRGDLAIELGDLADVAFHLGLSIELLPTPEHGRQPGPVPTVVDQVIQRLRGG